MGTPNPQSMTTTTNGAMALPTTGSDLLDLFARCGALREATYEDIKTRVQKAYDVHPLLTMKLLFYNRNIRGGNGERRTFRLMLRAMTEINSLMVVNNLHNIPYYGRFDDLFYLLDTELRQPVLEYIEAQIKKDVEAMRNEQPVTLAGKWMPSINTSSSETKALAYIISKHMQLTAREYRKTLVSLRSYIGIVEQKMTEGKWNEIEYETVPSRAMMIYRNAFEKHSPEKFAKYMESLANGEAEIKATTLYPYDIVERIGYSRPKSDKVLEAQWRALPNYVEGGKNILVMADVSGSMTWSNNGRPMSTSIGLAIYFAERATGRFHNRFMTFHTEPQMLTLIDGTLTEKIRQVAKAPWGGSTNFEKALNMVLADAVNNNLRQEELPVSIVCITDMQWNSATSRTDSDGTFMNEMNKRYEEYGYTMPNIVFWNVASPKDTFQAHANSPYVQMFSGQSAATFKNILANLGTTPFQAMVNTLTDEMYERVVM